MNWNLVPSKIIWTWIFWFLDELVFWNAGLVSGFLRISPGQKKNRELYGQING